MSFMHCRSVFAGALNVLRVSVIGIHAGTSSIGFGSRCAAVAAHERTIALASAGTGMRLMTAQ